MIHGHSNSVMREALRANFIDISTPGYVTQSFNVNGVTVLYDAFIDHRKVALMRSYVSAHALQDNEEWMPTEESGYDSDEFEDIPNYRVLSSIRDLDHETFFTCIKDKWFIDLSTTSLFEHVLMPTPFGERTFVFDIQDVAECSDKIRRMSAIPLAQFFDVLPGINTRGTDKAMADLISMVTASLKDAGFNMTNIERTISLMCKFYIVSQAKITFKVIVAFCIDVLMVFDMSFVKIQDLMAALWACLPVRAPPGGDVLGEADLEDQQDFARYYNDEGQLILDDYLDEDFNLPHAQIDATSISWLASLTFTMASAILLRQLPGKGDTMEFMTRMGALGRATTGTTAVFSTIEKIMKAAIEFISVKFLGHSPSSFSDLVKYVDGVDAWLDESQDLLQLESRILLLKETALCKRIEACYFEGLRISRAAARFTISREAMASFSNYFSAISKLYCDVDRTGAFNSGPRIEPVVILLYGESGIGKSGSVFPFAVELLKHINPALARDWVNNVYMRNVEQEYWDGYKSQPIVIYDDFGQMKDSASMPNPELLEIIRTGNIAPYPLHMASVEEKAKTKFDSRVIILTSNKIRPGIASLSCPDALLRRIDLCFEVTNFPQFTTDAPTAGGLTKPYLDPEKVLALCGTHFSTDVYRFQKRIVANSDAVGGPISYVDVVKQASAFIGRRYNKVTQFHDYLAAIAEQPPIAQVYPDPGDEKYIKDLKATYEKLTTREIIEAYIDDCFLGGYWDRPLDMELAEYYQDLLMMHNEPIEESPFGVHIAHAFCRPHPVVNLTEQGMYRLRQTADNFFNFEEGWNAVRYRDDLEQIFTINEWSIMDDPTDLRNLPKRIKCMFKEHVAKLKSHPLLVSCLKGVAVASAIVMALKMTGLAEKISSKIKNLIRGGPPKIKSKCVLYNSVVAKVKGRPYVSKRNLYCNRKCLVCDYFRAIPIPEKDGRPMTQAEFEKYCLKSMEAQVESMGVDTLTYDRFCKEGFTFGGESESSGDPRTMKSSRPIVETSGDPRTLKSVRPNVESHIESSGDPRTTSGAKPRKEGFPSVEIDGQSTRLGSAQAAVDRNAYDLINSKVLTNMYKLYTTQDGEERSRLNVLFIQGRIALTVKHLKPYIEKAEWIVLRNPYNSVGFRVPASQIKCVDIATPSGENKDAMLIEFPLPVCVHQSLVNNFINARDIVFDEIPANLIGVKFIQKGDRDHHISSTYSMLDARAFDTDLKYLETQDRIIQIRTYYSYSVETISGECGSVLVASSTSLARKLLGIHVCGKAGIGYASSITQEDIRSSLHRLSAVAQIDLNLDTLLSDTSEYIPEGDFLPVGQHHEEYRSPAKTNLRESLIHGDVSAPNTMPSMLRPCNGVDPMEKALKKAGVAPTYIDPVLIKRAVDSYRSVLFANTDDSDKRILTDMESVQGIDSEPFYAAVNRRSSPGFGWSKARTGGTIGKEHWLGKDEFFKLDQAVADSIHEYESLASQGIRKPTVYVDTLKDERRPIEKVLDGKTRVFAAGPMDYILVVRKYFLGFMAHVMKNRINNEISVGINPFGHDWDRLRHHLQQKGPKVFAGDFSNFDGTLSSQILEACCDLINEWYGDEHQLLRRTLFEEIIHSVHINGNKIYMWTHSQPSGNPLTAILNSLYNCISMRIVWQLLCGPHGYTIRDYNTYVNLAAYGDDNVGNVSDRVIDWFNQCTITEAYKVIGMVYTDETKSGASITYRHLNEVVFLKRAFRYVPEISRCFAPLNLDVVLEMANWIRGDLDQGPATLENVTTAIEELSLHEEAVFDKYKELLLRACRTRLKREPEVYDYDFYLVNGIDKNLI